MKRLTLVYILWLDAVLEYPACSPKHLSEGIMTESGGILVRETEDSVSFALTVHPDDGTCRNTMTIPRAYIKKIRKVKL